MSGQDLDYKGMFDSAKGELKRLHEQKANIEQHLNQLNDKIDAMSKTYNAIAPLVGERPVPTVADKFIPADIDALKAAGISVAVRYVLDSALSSDFTAATVRDALGEKGWDWTNYVNPLSTVHTVLTRLVASDAVKRGTKDGKRIFYSAKRPLEKTETPPIAVNTGIAGAFGIGDELLKKIRSNPVAGLGLYPSEEVLKSLANPSSPFADLLKSKGK